MLSIHLVFTNQVDQEKSKLYSVSFKNNLASFFVQGAHHHARFMAYAIYYLKIQLFSKRFAMSSTELSGVKRMANFIALYYTHAFLRSWLSSCSPAGDLHFLSLMKLYRTQDPSASDICVKSILLHLWYLTEELVVFAIFDTDIQDSLRQQIVLKLLSCQRPKIFKPQKPVFPDIDPMTIIYPYQLVDFIGSRS